MFRKKKPEQQQEQAKEPGFADYKGPHIIEHTDMPVRAPVLTYNFGDLIRYFKYNMSSGLLVATVERMVQDAMQDRNNFPTKLFFSLIAVGIMVFLIFLGGMVFLQNAPAAAAGAGAAGAGQAGTPSMVVG